MDYSCLPPTQDPEKRQLHFNCFHQQVCKNPIFHRLVFILLTFVRTTLHRGKGKKTLCVFMKNQTNMNIKISLNWYLKKVSPHTLLVVLLKKSFLHDNLRLNNSLWGIHEMLQSAFTKFWLQLFIAKFLAFWNPSTLLII